MWSFVDFEQFFQDNFFLKSFEHEFTYFFLKGEHMPHHHQTFFCYRYGRLDHPFSFATGMEDLITKKGVKRLRKWDVGYNCQITIVFIQHYSLCDLKCGLWGPYAFTCVWTLKVEIIPKDYIKKEKRLAYMQRCLQVCCS